MKKLLLLPLLIILLFGCQKDKDEEVPLGSLEVKISYYYNAFQGYKPDTGANLYLYKQTGKTYIRDFIDFRVGLLEVVGTGEKVTSDFKAEADVTGLAKINNIPYGDYLMVAASEGRFLYSAKPIKIDAPLTSDVKNFGYRNELDDNGEPW